MRKFVIILMVSILSILALNSQPFAQSDNTKDITIIIPTESVADFVQELLPYQFDFGKKFSGSFMVQSIDNIRIVKDKIIFSSHIVGENVEYSIKIVNRSIKVAVGNVKLRNNWEALLRYDTNKKILFVTPHIEGVIDKDDVSQGEMLLHALLEGLSDIEYPVTLNELKPIKTALNERDLFINIDITNIHAENGKLFIAMKPSAKYEENINPPAQTK